MAPEDVAGGQWPDLPDARRVYRAYRNESDRDKGGKKPKPKVFYRRESEASLSVGFSAEGAISQLREAFGVCEISVGAVRSCDSDCLDVVQDGNTHAGITGVPVRTNDLEAATRIARYLARIADDLYWPLQTG
jgi:hypothetical protein